MPEEKLAAPTGTPDCSRAEGRPTRRRALRVVAAVAGLPLMIAALRAIAPKAQLHSWHGDVLGALSELTLWHHDAAVACEAAALRAGGDEHLFRVRARDGEEVGQGPALDQRAGRVEHGAARAPEPAVSVNTE